MADRATRTPTGEQQRAIDLFGDATTDLVIEAGAGTGKTTTLGMCARATHRNGTYLAFNRMIANDAGRAMPMSVAARTVHSVAMAGIRQTDRRRLLDRIGTARMAPYKLAKRLGLGPLIVTIPRPEGGPRTKVLQPAWQASHVMRAVNVFCQSGDPRPGRIHFPYVEGIDPVTGSGRTFVNNRQVAKELEPALVKAWDDLTDVDGQLPWGSSLGHAVYLKLAQLVNVPIPGDYLLFDEAQDASPVMLRWLAQQERPTVYVGDSQQQIYEWRGAVNALQMVDEETPRAFLTQSWRFGPAVADVANTILDRIDGAELRLTGTPAIASTVWTRAGAPTARAMLCRTNGMAVNAVLQYQAEGLQPHLVGGADDIVRFARAAAQLQAGERTSHPELACFETWREVMDYVDNDPGGDDLGTMVRLIDKYGITIVTDALDGLIAEDGADVVISTAHKAKGREWPVVRLAPDFAAPEGRGLGDPEWRLLYVAATRAIDHLDIASCPPVRDLIDAA